MLSRYVFCCAPIPLQSPFVAACLLKFVRRFSNGEPITVQWLGDQIGWPLNKPKTLDELHHLEAIHDVLDLYQWLSYRFEVSDSVDCGVAIGVFMVCEINCDVVLF